MIQFNDAQLMQRKLRRSAVKIMTSVTMPGFALPRGCGNHLSVQSATTCRSRPMAVGRCQKRHAIFFFNVPCTAFFLCTKKASPYQKTPKHIRGFSGCNKKPPLRVAPCFVHKLYIDTIICLLCALRQKSNLSQAQRLKALL